MRIFDITPQFLQDAQDAHSYGLSSIGAFAWVCYDIAIAMDQEIEHIWLAKWSAAKVLYFLSRYVSPILLFFFWLTGTAQSLPESLCRAWPIASGIGMIIVGVSVDFIQLLRVRAIFKANRRVTIPLYLFFIGVFAAALGVIAHNNSGSTPPMADNMYSLGCVDNSNNTSTLAAWIAEMCLGGVFFLLTVCKLHPYLRRGTVRTPLLTAIVKGGVMYFAVIFAVEMLAAIFTQLMSTSTRPNLLNLLDPWALAVYGIAGPRLILHLRGVVTGSVDLDDTYPPTVGGNRTARGAVLPTVVVIAPTTSGATSV